LFDGLKNGAPPFGGAPCKRSALSPLRPR